MRAHSFMTIIIYFISKTILRKAVIKNGQTWEFQNKFMLNIFTHGQAEIFLCFI